MYSSGNAFLTYLLTFSSIAISCALYAYGNYTIGFLVAIVYLSTAVFNPISNIFELITYIKSNKKLSVEIYEDFKKENFKVNENKINEIDKFEITNLFFSYDKLCILNDVNLCLEKGKKYLLIGESGVGISTFLKILMKYLRYDGSIRVNGLELNTISESEINKFFSYVPQESFIFNDTIKSNIDLSGNHSIDEINEVCDKVLLSELINKKGLNAFISSEINEISGGEKQRISLARAIIKKPKVLLSDEVTASLDLKSTEEIEKTILALDDITIIYICHKISKDLLKSFDYVLKMENKKIVIEDISERYNDKY